MGFLLGIWNGLKDLLEIVLRTYEGLLEPALGLAAWGVSIILLTVTVRIFMIPLMVRQVRSMRTMQTLQPELKRIQEKYKVDRSMMKTDPERYKKIKEKQREAQMALYQEHGANPVGGCLPLLLQMPIFLALFQVLQEDGRLPELANAPFLGIQSLTDTAQGIITGGGEAGIAIAAAASALLLVVLQVVTTFYSSKQMMARNTQAAPEQQQAQKLMLYVMPPFLGFLSFTFPIGVVLYWTTTNLWTIGQQAFIFKQVEAEEQRKAEEREEEKRQKKQRTHVEEVTGVDDQSDDLVDEADGGRNGSGPNGSRTPKPGKGGKGGKGGGGTRPTGEAAGSPPVRKDGKPPKGSGPAGGGRAGDARQARPAGSGTTRRGGRGQPNRRTRP